MLIISDNRSEAPNLGASTGIIGLTVYIGLKIPNLGFASKFVVLCVTNCLRYSSRPVMAAARRRRDDCGRVQIMITNTFCTLYDECLT